VQAYYFAFFVSPALASIKPAFGVANEGVSPLLEDEGFFVFHGHAVVVPVVLA